MGVDGSNCIVCVCMNKEGCFVSYGEGFGCERVGCACAGVETTTVV